MASRQQGGVGAESVASVVLKRQQLLIRQLQHLKRLHNIHTVGPPDSPRPSHRSQANPISQPGYTKRPKLWSPAHSGR